MDIRYFRMRGADGQPANKIIFGEVSEENEKTMKIKGMYLNFNSRPVEQTEEDVVPSQGDVTLEPFSPVGDQVQTITIPMARIAEEYHEMPPQFAHTLMTIHAGESMNARRREQLLSYRVPNRSAATPEEALASIAQYVHEHGKLPEIFGSGDVNFNMHQGIEAGNFRTVETSPYRPETQK